MTIFYSLDNILGINYWFLNMAWIKNNKQIWLYQININKYVKDQQPYFIYKNWHLINNNCI